jgi:hypothetical protein
VELHRTDVAGIVDLHPLTESSYDEFDADAGSDDSSDLGGAEGKAPISLQQTEFSLKQFAKRMGQPNFGTFKEWKKVWVAGILKKNHSSSIPGHNRLKHMPHRPLHWDTAVAGILESLET